jgi:DNA helicase-2/ATP-dependent DNA helicase PcrA
MGVHSGDNTPWSDFAILYRTNRQSKNMEDALRRQGIPYKIYGNVSFYQRKEIKQALAYCRWAVNPYDEQALLSCINTPRRGIGNVSIDKLVVFARENNVPLWDALRATDDTSADSDTHSVLTARIPSGTLSKMAALALKIEKWNVLMPTTPADELLKAIWEESGLKRSYEDENTSESKDRMQNVEELIGSVNEFVKSEHTVVDPETGEIRLYDGVATLAMFLPEIALLTDQDTQDEKDERNSDRVVLMTVHSAKGLEFPYVFVTGLEDGLFPSSFGSEGCDLEEERRLFYVAVTRAKKQLWLSCAGMRFLHGNLQSEMPSPFLLELDAKYAEVVNVDQGGRREYDGGASYAGANGRRMYGAGYNRYGEREGGDYNRREYGAKGYSGSNIVPSRGNFKKVSSVKQTEPNAEASSSGEYAVGRKVLHDKFGKGTLLEVIGEGANQKFVVDFAQPIGTKTLLAAFAKLKILS